MTDLIVCNTGPIIALTIVDQLRLLNSLFSKVVVPDQVHQEILCGGSSGVGVSMYVQADWIARARVSQPIDELLTSLLDAGEASVIQLARELHASRVLLDERKARKIARTVYGLAVIGTAGILVLAKRKGLLSNVRSTLLDMREKGYWLHEDIMASAAKAAGEV